VKSRRISLNRSHPAAVKETQVADVLRRFFSRLGQDAISPLLARAGLPHVELDGLKPHQRSKAAIAAVLHAPDGIRGPLEAVAGNITSLADRGDNAEVALRAVCEGYQHLLEILETDRSLEERILIVSVEQPKLLDRARNLAMSLAWRDSRYQCSFEVDNPKDLARNIDDAVESIRRIVQNIQGGRKVYAEGFTYSDADSTTSAGRVHHIALYLETPASYLMEFKEGEGTAVPVLRREAREMAIDYNAATGRLDVTGKGVGGTEVLREVAEEFRAQAVSDASLTALKRPTWPMGAFLSNVPPPLQPPEGFALVHVSEIALRSQRQNGATAVFRGPHGGTAYDRLRELGIDLAHTAFESISSATLTLDALPDDVGLTRPVRVTLRLPNALSFDGAGVRDRREIKAWLERHAFASINRQCS
jgi:hypothetical protein